MNNRLTVNVGLRWELLPPFVDKNGIAANFDPNYSGQGANGQGAIVINDFGLKTAPAFLASFNAVVTNGQDGLPAGLRQKYLRNFDPRVSVAYRPFRDNKTVVRAGFGIFTVTALGQLQNNLESTPQAAVNLWQNNNEGAPLFTFPRVIPPGAGLQFGGGIFEQGVDPHYPDAQSA